MAALFHAKLMDSVPFVRPNATNVQVGSQFVSTTTKSVRPISNERLIKILAEALELASGNESLVKE